VPRSLVTNRAFRALVDILGLESTQALRFIQTGEAFASLDLTDLAQATVVERRHFQLEAAFGGSGSLTQDCRPHVATDWTSISRFGASGADAVPEDQDAVIVAVGAHGSDADADTATLILDWDASTEMALWHADTRLNDGTMVHADGPSMQVPFPYVIPIPELQNGLLRFSTEASGAVNIDLHLDVLSGPRGIFSQVPA